MHHNEFLEANIEIQIPYDLKALNHRHIIHIKFDQNWLYDQNTEALSIQILHFAESPPGLRPPCGLLEDSASVPRGGKHPWKTRVLSYILQGLSDMVD